MLRWSLYRVALLFIQLPGGLTGILRWQESQAASVLARLFCSLRVNGAWSTSSLPRITDSSRRRSSSPCWGRLNVVDHGWVPRAGAEETELLYSQSASVYPRRGYSPRLGAFEHRLQTRAHITSSKSPRLTIINININIYPQNYTRRCRDGNARRQPQAGQGPPKI